MTAIINQCSIVNGQRSTVKGQKSTVKGSSGKISFSKWAIFEKARLALPDKVI